MFSDLRFFLKQALLEPKQTSSLVPSSRALAAAMAAHVGPASGPVIEFGPGTGIITEAILNRGVTPSNLTLFEMNPAFAATLATRFPGTTIHTAGAQNAPNLMPHAAGAVVSGLPLLSMPRDLRREIIAAAFQVMRPDGIFIQFTYGHNAPLSVEGLNTLGLIAKKARKVWANFPPAQVYILKRAKI
ncbi:class I SAM-dependent methyltransferase [Pseudorhodobacter ferrugineus]|uniref:class I SAM-dependent methyltransferase n=1 Tax=Pseudorhodobacter ferrugineus TaxID=77008 RepID=UPI0003B5591E|nr:methyltransferase type 12 [Pseudorhodobacter ferrugineus]